jgi:phosphatidate cytidylyltransferase
VAKNIQFIFLFSFVLLSVFTLLIRRLQKKQFPSAGELMGRVQTFWGMLLLLFIAATTPRAVTFVFVGLISAVALYEYLSWQKLSTKDFAVLDRASRGFAFFLIPVQLIFLYLQWEITSLVLIPFCLVVVFPSLMVLRNRPAQVLALYGFLASAVLFFVFAFPLAAALTRFGLMPLLLCFLLTELRDLLSYWLGKFFSKQGQRNPQSAFFRWMNVKIAPAVSPNKSWGVGVLSALLLAALNLGFLKQMPATPQGPLAASFMIGWALAIGLVGLMGDLVFSLFKREFGLKDSGSFMPGNTGIIDRIDSLILTVPTTYFLFFFHFFGEF